MSKPVRIRVRDPTGWSSQRGMPIFVLIVILTVLVTCAPPCASQAVAETAHIVEVNRHENGGRGPDMCAKWRQRCSCMSDMVRCRGVTELRMPRLSATTEWLNIQRSRIRAIQSHAFRNSTQLTRIHIINSGLEHIHIHAFVGLVSLTQLLLSGNELYQLSPGTFRNLPELRMLNLHSNKLQYIPTGTFQLLPELHHLMLHSNRIQQVQGGALDGTSRNGLLSLSLHHNRLHCNCSIRYLKELDYYVNIRDDGETTTGRSNIHQVQQDERMRQRQRPWQCSTPANLAEKHIRSLTVRDIGCSQPTADIHQPLQTAVEGSTVRFFCWTGGFPTPTVTWAHDGIPIAQYNHSQTLAQAIAFNNRLWLHSVTTADAGTITCTARNIAGVAHSTARLIVEASPRPPSIQLTPRFLRVIVTGTAQLQCTSTQDNGNRPHNVTWLWNGHPLDSDRNAIRNKVEVLDNGILRIPNVVESDEGYVTCTAQNDVGTSSRNANITVDDCMEIFQQIVGFTVDFARSNLTTFPAVPKPLEGLSVVSAMQLMHNATLAALTLRQLPDLSASSLGDWLNMPDDAFDFMARLMQDRAEDMSVVREAYQRIRLVRIARRIIASGHWSPRGRPDERVDSSERGYADSLVTERQLSTVERLADCMLRHRSTGCTNPCFDSKYRSLDGSCNNRKNPDWGAADTPLHNLAPAVYADGYSLPLGVDVHPIIAKSLPNSSTALPGTQLPTPREVSTRLISALEIELDLNYTQLFTQWGQFLDHDITLTELMTNEECRDFTCDEQQEKWSACLSIPASRNDPRLNATTCIGTSRSRAMCGTGASAIFYRQVKPRQVMNTITAFIDGSQIYGSSETKSNRLREGSSDVGRMQELQQRRNGKGIPPFALPGEVDCPRQRRLPAGTPANCLLAGDRRINEQLDLTALHIVWFRQHKNIVKKLSFFNEHWGDEKVFHEARKIVGAQLQHITFTHWLPKLLGVDNKVPPYSGYNDSVNPSIIAAFSTAAFRFGHAMINPLVRRLDAAMQETPEGNLNLREAFFAPDRILHEGGVDPLIRGMLMTPSKVISPTQILTNEVTEHLFRFVTTISEDLAALNIQRGRDHGLPGYNTFRRICRLPEFQTFDEMGAVTDAKVIDILKELYRSPDDLDLWVGGLVESPRRDARVGPLFSCLIKKQLTALRDGDRLWYENEGVFSVAQLREIRKTTLAGVLCENGDNIQHLPPDVFLLKQFPDDFQNCSQLPEMDLEPWRDCSECELFNGCRRRAARTLHEAEVTVFGEEGSIVGTTANAAVPVAVPGAADNILLVEEVTSETQADLSSATRQPQAEFLQDIDSWQELLARHPQSPLAHSIRELGKRAGIGSNLPHDKEDKRSGSSSIVL